MAKSVTRDYREGDWVRFKIEAPEAVGQVTSIDTPRTYPDHPWPERPTYVVKTPDGESRMLRHEQILGVSNDIVSAIAGIAGRKLSLRFRWRRDHEHVRATLFVGQPGCTLANAGSLTMRTDEWMSFSIAINLVNAASPHVDIDFVEQETE